jgi:hypothetical protein
MNTSVYDGFAALANNAAYAKVEPAAEPHPCEELFAALEHQGDDEKDWIVLANYLETPPPAPELVYSPRAGRSFGC